MVLEGERPRSGGKTMRVRVTIRPEGPDRVVQEWQTTSGSGSWKDDGAVIFQRS